MTAAAIAALSAGEELDALIARHVMGWRFMERGPWPDGLGERQAWHGTPPDVPAGRLRLVPFYSRRLEDAWRVIEHLEDFKISNYDGLWIVTQGRHDEHCAQADTAPLAICRAALLAVNAPINSPSRSPSPPTAAPPSS